MYLCISLFGERGIWVLLSGDNYMQGDKRTGEPELGLIEFQIGPGKNLNPIIHCKVIDTNTQKIRGIPFTKGNL